MINFKLNPREKLLLGMSMILGATLGIIIGRILIGIDHNGTGLNTWNIPDIISSITGGILGIFWFFIRKHVVDKQN